MTLETPLDQALFMVLVHHDIDVQARGMRWDGETSAWTLPDLSDIHTRTRETTKALCTGEIDPDWWMDEYEKAGRWTVSPATSRGVYTPEQIKTFEEQSDG